MKGFKTMRLPSSRTQWFNYYWRGVYCYCIIKRWCLKSLNQRQKGKQITSMKKVSGKVKHSLLSLFNLSKHWLVICPGLRMPHLQSKQSTPVTLSSYLCFTRVLKLDPTKALTETLSLVCNLEYRIGKLVLTKNHDFCTI